MKSYKYFWELFRFIPGMYTLEFRQRIPNVNTTGSKNHLSKRLFRQQV